VLWNAWVTCLAVDAQGNLWIGTIDWGLAVYREGGVILRPTSILPTTWGQVKSLFQE
jgi:hypothetical protein